jgi:hypothetical protein
MVVEDDLSVDLKIVHYYLVTVNRAAVVVVAD